MLGQRHRQFSAGGPGRQQGRVDEHDPERHAVGSREVRDLNHRRQRRLRVAEEKVRQAGEQRTAEPVDAGPEHGGGEDRDGRPPVRQRPPQDREQREVAGEVRERPHHRPRADIPQVPQPDAEVAQTRRVADSQRRPRAPGVLDRPQQRHRPGPREVELPERRERQAGGRDERRHRQRGQREALRQRADGGLFVCGGGHRESPHRRTPGVRINWRRPARASARSERPPRFA